MYCCWGAMKCRKALLSEEELLETKSAKRVRKLLKHVSRLCTGKNRTKHIDMISINTYHLAYAKDSALQCFSLAVAFTTKEQSYSYFAGFYV